MSDQTSATSAFHMVELWLDTGHLTRLARALHLPLRIADDNYIVHCALGELFGDERPSPFCLEGRAGRHLRLLAYSSIPAPQLQAAAQATASPMVYQTCEWSRIASKPMPSAFAAGTPLRFEFRGCPVVRKAGSGVEVDAFLAHVWHVDDPETPVQREDVYRDWLGDQLLRRGGAELRSARLESFSLDRMLRRTHGSGRTAGVIKRPAATLSGLLQVTDPEAFTALLRSGIGRHRSFGFGMLKVRPVGR